MSATNRGAVRKESDFYPTPTSAINALLENYEIGVRGQSDEILEPCAGDGRIIKALQEKGYKNIKAIEIRMEEAAGLNDLVGYGNFAIADYLELNEASKKHIGKPDVILTNPPFSIAMEFLQKSLDLVAPDGKVIFLLRLGFLASDKRFDFMKNNPPTDMLVLHKRPSFTGKGTDAQEYAWFVWDKAKKGQQIKVI